jgi:adhesin transport system outer membrane protein
VRGADARATRIREEAARDAAIAWSDVRALEQQLAALESSYIASRRSRDVLLERFINSRGDLFDVVAAEDAYFASAAAYIQALSELDAARYVLLSRTGGLLTSLAIDPAQIGGQRE